MFKVNDNYYIRHKALTNKDFEFGNIHIRCNFSQIDEMRISFCSCRELMKYVCYITQPMPAIERKLNQNLAKNPKLEKNSQYILYSLTSYTKICSLML